MLNKKQKHTTHKSMLNIDKALIYYEIHYWPVYTALTVGFVKANRKIYTDFTDSLSLFTYPTTHTQKSLIYCNLI